MHSLFKLAQLTLLAIATTLLFACSSPQISLQLQPELSINQNRMLSQSQLMWNIGSQDQRIAHYLIEINKGDKAARLINESQSSRLIIENTLRTEWIKQGLLVQPESRNKIDVQLIKLLAKVEQSSLSFINNANIVISVELNNGLSVFSKTYKSHFYEEGVLTADSEKISEQLNNQLSQLLNEIIQDPELNAKLQKI